MTSRPPAEGVTDRATLDRYQRARLAELLETIRGHNAFYTRKLDGIEFDAIRDDLTKLPLTTREELQYDQAAHPPFGTNLTYPLERYCRYHQTSGTSGTPLRWLDTTESWSWFVGCWQRIFEAADVTVEDRAAFPFSFGPFVGFWAAFEAATRLGMLSLPAGGMSTSARLRYIVDNDVTIVCCTPTYALRMGEQAANDGIDLPASSVRALIVAGEPGGGIPAIRTRIEGLWSARVYDHVGMTEMGAWGFETTVAPGDMHVLETEFIAEVIDTDRGDPVDAGEPGELVLTNLGRWGSPLIRYRTGDRVQLTTEPGPSGLPFSRVVDGVAGRVDDMLIVRGNNVFPSALEGILRELPGLAEYRVRVRRRAAMDELTIELEAADDADAAALAREAEHRLRDRLHFGVKTTIVPTGSLPRFEMKARRIVREETKE